MSENIFDIRGRAALVTGGSKGIGYLVARGLLEAGATVVICSRNARECEGAAHELSAHGNCIGIGADLSRMEDITGLVARVAEVLPRLDILVNNAGASWADRFDTYAEQQWDTVVDTNLKAPFFLMQQFLPLLRKAATRESPARVINIGSIAGLIPMSRDSYAYAASKAGLHHMTLHLARHLAPDITVNAIAPGAFETRMIGFALDQPAARAALEAVIPRGMVGQGDDIAGVVRMLASRAGAYVTGAVIPVDGGLSLRNP